MSGVTEYSEMLSIWPEGTIFLGLHSLFFFQKWKWLYTPSLKIIYMHYEVIVTIKCVTFLFILLITLKGKERRENRMGD